MDDGLLSLKWNNHRSTFFHMLSSVRRKECYTDVTLACDGNFYPVHKLVLSTCSEYFEQMFEQTQCKHPVIVLKDIRCEDLESLLSYMYVGEVNVVQEKLAGLIKAAECLKIKGLAVPDEEPPKQTLSSGRSGSSGGGGGGGGGRDKRTSDSFGGSEAKRRKQDGASDMYRQSNANSRNEERRRSIDSSASNSNKSRTSISGSGNVNSSSSVPRGDSSAKSSSREQSITQASQHQQPQPQQQQQQQQQQGVTHEADEEDVKSEPPGDYAETQPELQQLDDEAEEPVKQEPPDLDAVYLSDSNSAHESKDNMLMDNFSSDGQQHFMEELMGHDSSSDQGHLGVGKYDDGGGGGGGGDGGAAATTSAAGRQQHGTVGAYNAAGCSSLMTQPLAAAAASDAASDARFALPRLKLLRISPHLLSQPLTEDLYPDEAYNANSSFEDKRIEERGVMQRLQEQFLEASLSSMVKMDAPSNYTMKTCLTSESSEVCEQSMVSRLVIPPFDSLNIVQLMTDAKALQCPLCLKEFPFISKFKRHYMIHTGDYPFQCHLCRYKTNQKQNLNIHMATHASKIIKSV